MKHKDFLGFYFDEGRIPCFEMSSKQTIHTPSQVIMFIVLRIWLCRPPSSIQGSVHMVQYVLYVYFRPSPSFHMHYTYMARGRRTQYTGPGILGTRTRNEGGNMTQTYRQEDGGWWRWTINQTCWHEVGGWNTDDDCIHIFLGRWGGEGGKGCWWKMYNMNDTKKYF